MFANQEPLKAETQKTREPLDIHTEVTELHQQRSFHVLVQKVEEEFKSSFLFWTEQFPRAVNAYIAAVAHLNRYEDALRFLLHQLETLSPTDPVREALGSLLKRWVVAKPIGVASTDTIDLLLAVAQDHPEGFLHAPEVRHHYLELLERMGVVAWKQPDLETARKLLAERSQHAPNSSEAWMTWGWVEQASGDYETARRVFDQGARVDSSYAPIWRAWALMEQQLGDTDMARALFTKATLANARYAPAWASWGRMEFLQGRVQVGREIFRQGIEAQRVVAQRYFLHNQWAIAEMQDGDYERAWEQVNLILQDHPDNRPALRTAGTLAYRENRYEVAEDYLARSLYPKLTTDSQKRHNVGVNLARINNFWLWGQYDAALALAQQGMREGDDAAAQFQRRHELAVMLSLYADGHEAASLDQYQVILQGCADNAEEYNQLSNALKRMSQFDLAELHYRDAIELDPLEPKFYNNLGMLLEETDRLGEALYCYELANRLSPNFFWARQSVERLCAVGVQSQSYALPNTSLMTYKVLEAAGSQSYLQQRRALEVSAALQLEDAVPSAIRLLDSDDGDTRHTAMNTLTSLRSWRAIEPLLVLRRKKERERLATHLLKQIVIPERLGVLIDLFQRMDKQMRHELAEVISTWESSQAVNAYLEMLRRSDESAHRTICWFLSQCATENTIELIVDTLLDPDHTVRQAIAALLARLNSPSAVEPLRKLLATSRDVDVQRKVRWLLHQIHSE
jgi:tetratricopeptide (TPR) repeat protein